MPSRHQRSNSTLPNINKANFNYNNINQGYHPNKNIDRSLNSKYVNKSY